MHKIDVVEMKMLGWMCRKTGKDKIRNELFQNHLFVASLGDKIR